MWDRGQTPNTNTIYKFKFKYKKIPNKNLLMCEIEDKDAKVEDKSGDANDEEVATCQLENLTKKTF